MNLQAAIASWPRLFPNHCNIEPWVFLAELPAFISTKQRWIDPKLYDIEGDVAVHKTAIVEQGAVIKGPAIIGEGVLVASGAYLRGGVLLEADVIIGPGSEVKTSVLCAGTKLAHFNFVGDSILGANVNLEAGSIIANYRNEMDVKRIKIKTDTGIIDTGVDKFGALIGDDVKIGANAVIAPGALIASDSLVPRQGLVDQYPFGHI